MANLVIIVLQPEDHAVRTAARRLAAKPSVTYSDKVLCTMDMVPPSTMADKVYLVGHGGENTLGGMAPELLAMNVLGRPSLLTATKLVLVMCGDGSMLAAKDFAEAMRAGVPLLDKPPYRGEIVAYKAPLLISAPLDGMADEHIGRKMAEVEGTLWTARKFKEFL
jgi:hypothetical protein